MRDEEHLARTLASKLTVESFTATLAYGRQLLWMLFLANVIGWAWCGLAPCAQGVAAAIAATALAYVAQMAITSDLRHSFPIMVASVVAGLWSAWALIVGIL